MTAVASPNITKDKESSLVYPRQRAVVRAWCEYRSEM